MLEFKASETFWKAFYALDARTKELVRQKWATFKLDPFDPSLGTHKIIRLTALHGTTVYSVVLAGDLRVVFKIVNGNQVYTIDIGTHGIYK